jgi:hypothetical protein
LQLINLSTRHQHLSFSPETSMDSRQRHSPPPDACKTQVLLGLLKQDTPRSPTQERTPPAASAEVMVGEDAKEIIRHLGMATAGISWMEEGSPGLGANLMPGDLVKARE